MSIELIIVIVLLLLAVGIRRTAQGAHGLFRPMVAARR
jgi:hypothetical protein